MEPAHPASIRSRKDARYDLLEDIATGGMAVIERELALVAIAAGDRGAFELHCETMTAHFRNTQQPSLVRHVEELWTRAVARGLHSRPTMNIVLAEADRPDQLDLATHVEARPGSRGTHSKP